MPPLPHPAPALSAARSERLLRCARHLQQGICTGAQPLRDRKLAVLCASTATAEATFFAQAAAALGAQVALLRPGLAAASTRRDIERVAHILGRLYDAIECQGLPASVVHQLCTASAVPVFDGLGTAAHPVASIADRLDEEPVPGTNRRLLVQAALLDVLT